MRLTFFVPGRITNPLNSSHGHWSIRATWAKRWRAGCACISGNTLLSGSVDVDPASPKRVTFTGHVPRLFDDDNFRAAMKPVRDGLQDAGIIHHDGPRCGHVFEYEQVRRGDYGVSVTVEW